jgi:hypothetical protein
MRRATLYSDPFMLRSASKPWSRALPMLTRSRNEKHSKMKRTGSKCLSHLLRNLSSSFRSTGSSSRLVDSDVDNFSTASKHSMIGVGGVTIVSSIFDIVKRMRWQSTANNQRCRQNINENIHEPSGAGLLRNFRVE